MKTNHAFKRFSSFVLLLAYALFLYGFFPVKRSLSGCATKTTKEFYGQKVTQPGKKFDKVILMLIDALRADFIFERNLIPFMNMKLVQGNGHGFTLRAHPPTVTLPRIKALTAGSIPGFIDIVLNYDSSETGEDNIVTQAYRDGQRIVFYGDDTWLKLFPHHFTDSDGTTSFFVTDYTEVDDNVTRHIDSRLSALDWDMMILHYLGLDHIGHTVGPNSPLVISKLAEMDGVVEKIYNSLEQKGEDFVMLICGDHGMSDQGSHGGASNREVFVPAVFISPKLNTKKGTRWRSTRELLQIDLAPTLSMLMGLPVPNNNLGQGLVDMLDGFTDIEKLNLLYFNCQQVLQLLEQNLPDPTRERSYDLYIYATKLHASYLNESTSNKPDVSSVIRAYETAMDAMATKISKSLTTYDMFAIELAVIILFLVLTLETLHVIKGVDDNSSVNTFLICTLLGAAMFCHVTVCTSQSYSSSSLCGGSLLSVSMAMLIWIVLVCLILMILNTIKGFKRVHYMHQPSSLGSLLLLGTVIHSLSFLSSSFVEEEHQTWYFLSMTFYLFVLIQIFVTSFNKYHKKLCNNSGDITSELYDKCLDNRFENFTNSQLENKVTNDGDQIVRSRQKEEMKNERLSDINGEMYRQIRKQRREKKELELDKEAKITMPWKEIFLVIVIMCIGRFLRTVNQTGNKWLDLPDLGDWLVREENKYTLTYISIGSVLVIAVSKVKRFDLREMLFLLGLVGCLCYRLSTGTIQNVFRIPGYVKMSNGIREAYFVYGIIGLMNLSAIIKFLQNSFCSGAAKNSISEKEKHSVSMETVETFQLSWIVLMTLLLRPHNTLLVAMVTLQEQLLWKRCITKVSLSVWCHSIICWWIGQTTFFQQGNSNSLSTVDVSAGYVGLQDYHPAIVATLLYCSTYAGPVFWLMTLVKYLLHHCISIQDQSAESQRTSTFAHRLDHAISTCIQTLTLERVFTLCLYCVVVTIERYHLFVWTVFSPKLLYEGMLTVTYFLFTVMLSLVQLTIYYSGYT